MKRKKKHAALKRVTFPELEDLYYSLEPILPGDDIPEMSDRLPDWFTPDGQPKRDPANYFLSSTFYRSGVRIKVSTVYLGLNYSFGGTLPLFWETMVFTDGGELDDVFTMRYATRNAAKVGHTAVVTAIRDAQRARRAKRVPRYTPGVSGRLVTA